MTERRAGFTLLEVVLAMAALAMVVGICYGAFHLGMRAVERGEVAVVTEQRLRAASDILIRQVKSAKRYCVYDPDDTPFPYFTGSATSLAFVTAAGQQHGGGLMRVVYRLEEDPTRLVLEESPYFSATRLGREPVDDSGQSAVLLEGFRTLTFEYLVNDGSDTPEWQPSFDGQGMEMMPAAVRVTVTGMPGLELGEWAQEIPIMASAYGESNECGEEDEPEDTGDGEDETNPAAANDPHRSRFDNSATSGGGEDDAGGDDE